MPDIATATPLAGTPAPVSSKERIQALDVLRGVALCGILLMNIVGFGLPFHAYNDPTAAGGAEGLNLGAWWMNHLFFEGTMRTMFSMLFGAGVILLTSRAEAKAGAVGASDIYFRRNLWLIVFGMIHAYIVLWYGDILYTYGIVGLVLYVFRKQRPALLALVAVAALGVHVTLAGLAWHEHGEAYRAYQEAQAAGENKTAEQQGAVEAWEGVVAEVKGTPEELQQAIDGRQQGYFGVFEANAPTVHMMESVFLYDFFFVDALAAMMLGMALFRMGVLTGERSTGLYAAMVAAGYALGLAVNYGEGRMMVDSGFDVLAMDQAGLTYDVGRLSMAAGHIGIVMLFCKSGALGFLRRSLAAVGQTALTNYVMHSVICAFLFSGFGFGLFGKLERHELYYVVVSIWLFQLVVSPIWLSRFRFGPLEWVWRSLTYWKRQPMRLQPRKVEGQEAALAS